MHYCSSGILDRCCVVEGAVAWCTGFVFSILPTARLEFTRGSIVVCQCGMPSLNALHANAAPPGFNELGTP